MTSLPSPHAPRTGFGRTLVAFAAISLFSSALLAQDQNNRQQRRADRQAAQAGQAGQAGQADAGNGNNGFGRGGRGGGNFDPAQMQEQMMTRMREQLEVTDDAEWKLISDRITAVMDARRNTGGAGGGMGALFGRGGGGNFQGGQGGQGGGRGGRGGFTASPESDALRQAIADKLPDAELKARMARLRETRKANEEKLAKAQEDLRAVLTVRQEAMAVSAGVLP